MAGFALTRWARSCWASATAAYCIGCCSVLMAILFVGGVMNVLWIAAVTILVLLEKTVPGGRVISRVSGAGLFAGGVWMLAHTLG